MPTKKPARTTISLDAQLYQRGLQLAARQGFGNSFSAYIAWLITRDAQGGVERETLTPGLDFNSKPDPTSAQRRRAGRA